MTFVKKLMAPPALAAHVPNNSPFEGCVRLRLPVCCSRCVKPGGWEGSNTLPTFLKEEASSEKHGGREGDVVR